MGLKPKLMTCSKQFVDKYQLQYKGLTEPCPGGQHKHLKPQAQLSIILGVDVMHIAPKLVKSFEDKHGYLALYACGLSDSLVVMGIRKYPLSSTSSARSTC